MTPSPNTYDTARLTSFPGHLGAMGFEPMRISASGLESDSVTGLGYTP